MIKARGSGQMPIGTHLLDWLDEAVQLSAAKNATLMSERGISFEDVVFALQSGGLLDDVVHANRQKYPRQRMFVVRIDAYAWLVPYVENNDAFFLKTIIPSRRATKQYLGGKHE